MDAIKHASTLVEAEKLYIGLASEVFAGVPQGPRPEACPPGTSEEEHNNRQMTNFIGVSLGNLLSKSLGKNNAASM